MTGSDRSAVLARVAEAVAPGARQHTAWERVGGGRAHAATGAGPADGRGGPSGAEAGSTEYVVTP